MHNHQKEQAHGLNWRKSDTSFCASTLSKVSENMSNSCSDKLWQCGYQGSSLQTHCPRLLLELSHVVPSAWHVQKFESLRRKAGVQRKPHCTHSFDILISSGSGGNAPQIQGSHTLASEQTLKRAFLRIAVSGLLLTLFCMETKSVKLQILEWVLKLFPPRILMYFSSWISTLIGNS